jgi:CBS domain-containing protein
MKVREIMTQPVTVVQEDATLEEVAQTMLDRGIGCVPVVDREGRLTGVIVESDFTGKERGFPFSAYVAPQLLGEWVTKEGVERIYEAARTRTAKEIMTTQPAMATEDEEVTELVAEMIDHGLHRMPVVRNGVPVGIVTRHDLLKMMAREAE